MLMVSQLMAGVTRREPPHLRVVDVAACLSDDNSVDVNWSSWLGQLCWTRAPKADTRVTARADR